jgi:hypothetical protein
MAKNVSTSPRTKHVDVRYHYVREFVEDGFVKIIFVRTDKNHADMFTKNVKGEVMEKHRPEMMGDKDELESFETGRVLEGVPEDSMDSEDSMD